MSASASPASPFPSGGGSGSVNVTTTRDCTWTATTNANWVSLTGARDGQGNGTIAFAVAANTVPSARSGSISIASQQVQLSQAAAPCRFSLSRSSDSVGAAGGRLSVDVTTLTGCSWTASSAASWISVSSGPSGNASGTVGLTVAPNGGAARSGQVSIGGQTYSVSQAAVATDPTPPPNPPPPGANVHVEGIAVVVDGRCPDVTFFVTLQKVVTDRSTDFSKGKCGDLRTGSNVEVDGVLADGVVRASRVRFNKDDGDNGQN